jgi:hypothetical protein
MRTRADLERMFEHHPPRSEQRANQHQGVRRACLNLAVILNGLPDSDESDWALYRLREAMMWANAALALAPDPQADREEIR